MLQHGKFTGEAGRRSSCAGNLHQIGTAIAMYATDFNRSYPHVTNTILGQKLECAWADRLLPYTRSQQVFECPTAPEYSYVSGCPPDSKEEGINGFTSRFDGGYSLNRLNTKSHPYTVNEIRLRHPFDTISVFDGRGEVLGIGSNPIPNLATLHLHGVIKPRHGSGLNVLWMDGHVKWSPIESLVDRRLWIAAEKPEQN